jgi:fructose-1-phosphate kinase PfkB-like protein
VLLAAFLAGRLEGRPSEDALRLGVAAATASTLVVGAGKLDPREAGRLVNHVRVEELEPVHT